MIMPIGGARDPRCRNHDRDHDPGLPSSNFGTATARQSGLKVQLLSSWRGQQFDEKSGNTQLRFGPRGAHTEQWPTPSICKDPRNVPMEEAAWTLLLKITH